MADVSIRVKMWGCGCVSEGGCEDPGKINEEVSAGCQ